MSEGPTAPGSRRLEEPPDPGSSLVTGFTGGLVGTPADMVNVRSVLLVSWCCCWGRLVAGTRQQLGRWDGPRAPDRAARG